MSKISFIDIKKSKIDFLLSNKLKDFFELKRIIGEIKKAEKSGKKVILSKNIKEKYKNEEKISKIINSYSLDKSLYKDNLEEILNIVISNNSQVPVEQTIYFSILENTPEVKNKIESLKEKYKLINIVSPNSKSFLNMEDENIIVINNKKKSLKRAKFIVNIDFNEEILKQYVINREAVILNLSNNKIKNLIGFDGYIINNIRFINDNGNYSVQDIYSANKTKTDIIKQKIANKEIQLIGNNTVIALTKQ